MMTLRDLYSQHYRPARLVGAAAHTKKRFEMEITRLEEMLGRKAVLTDLNTNAISSMLEMMLESGLATGTVAGSRKKIRALWQFAYLRRLVDNPPELPEIREEVDPPTAWSEDELKRLLKACRETKGELCGIPAHLFWHSLVCCILDTATRIGAVLKVEWTDVNLDRGTMLFRAANQKTRQGQIHPLRPETIAELRLMRLPERELVWPLPFTYVNLGYHYKKILERAGLPSGHRDMWHKLRRTTATMFAKAGGDASHLLGHTSIKHLRRYLDETMLDRPTPARLLPALNQPIASRRDAKTELERLLAEFLEAESKEDRSGNATSPKTIAHLRNGVTRFMRLGKLETIADLSGENLVNVAERIASGYTPGTFNNYRSHFRRFCRWLIRQGHSVESVIEVVNAQAVEVAGGVR